MAVSDNLKEPLIDQRFNATDRLATRTERLIRQGQVGGVAQTSLAVVVVRHRDQHQLLRRSAGTLLDRPGGCLEAHDALPARLCTSAR